MVRGILKKIVVFLLLFYFLYATYQLVFPITAKQIVGNYSNPEEAIKVIERWQLDNIRIMDGCKSLEPIPLLMCKRYFLKEKRIDNFSFCIRGKSNTRWIRFARCGMCGENSFLFSEFANSIGIITRSLHDDRIDHAWAESWINNSWVIIDPSQNQYNLPYNYYEGKDWGYKNHTYVYAQYENGSEVDRTQEYTKTVRLSVFVKNDSNLKNIKIYAQKPTCITNAGGYCIFNLGDNNNYSIVAEKYKFGFLIRYTDTKEVFLDEKFPNVEIVLSPKIDFKWYILLAEIIIILFLVYILNRLKKKKKISN